jgi:TolA-binding protein
MRKQLLWLTLVGSLLSPAFSQSTLIHADPEATYRTALELMDKSKYGAAREAFEQYIRATSNAVHAQEARYYVAFCALNLYHADGEKLVENFIRENEHHPKAVLAYYELGLFYYRDKKYNKAVEYFAKVEMSALTEEQRAEARFKWGYSYFNLRKWDEALEQFNVLKRQPHTYAASASYYAGHISYEKGDYNTALADFRKAGESETYAAAAPFLVASSLYKLKRYDELLSYLDSQLDKGKRLNNETDMRLLAGEAWFRKGEYAKAASYYDAYLQGMGKVSPPRDVLYRIGYTQYAVGNDAKAVESFKQVASDKDTIGVQASYYMGVAYTRQNNKVYALTAFDVARKNKFDTQIKEEGSFLYGKVALDMGKSSDAITSLQQYTRDYPNGRSYAEANDLLSEAFLTSNDYDKAIAHIETLPRRTANVERAYQKATYLKGADLFNKGLYKESVAYFEKSLASPMDQEYADMARFWMAEAYSYGKLYDQAIDHYLRLVGSASARNSDIGLKARYGLGYAYFNAKTYDKALVHFREYVNQTEKARDQQNYADALLRLADCYYVTKQYSLALDTYRKASRVNKVDNDYAHLQQGVVAAIQGNAPEARTEFDFVIKNFPNSRYFDEALYQRGLLDFETGNYEGAVTGFTNLLTKVPNSGFAPYAYMRRASSYYNLKNYDRTIADYKAVLDKFPSHPISGDALLPLQEVLVMQNRASEFDAYLTKVRAANPEAKGLENVEFEAAKNMYFNQEYTKTIQAYQVYLANYPNSPKADEAKFYIAESYFRLKDNANALRFYLDLLPRSTAPQTSRIAQRVAEVEFAEGRYDRAIAYFHSLVRNAQNKREEYNGWSGLMESHYLLGVYDSAAHFSRVILEKGNINMGAQNRATLYLGKSYFAQGNFEAAKDEFLLTLNTAKDVNGAEAQYLLGVMLADEQQFRQSNEALIELTKSFATYHEWVGKAYLRMADNFVALGDTFQAKGTLKSVAEGFPLDHVRKAAAAKLAEIEVAEKKSQDN